jgi:hypothetical protein
MANLSQVVKQLHKERQKVQAELTRLDSALAALGSLSVNGAKRGKHSMSTSARRKISFAQKARWAKQKATPRRTISAAGRKRIAAAQRARWRKVKKAQKVS